MGTKYTQTSWRGVCLLDPRWSYANYSVAHSTATQDGAEADQPVITSGRGSYMMLEARGSITEDDTVIDVLQQKEGLSSGGTSGGRFVWKNEDDSATQYKGWLAYNKVTSFEQVLFSTSAGNPYTSFGGYQAPHGLRTPGHRAIVVYDDQTSAAGVVKCMYRDITAASWTHVTIYTQGANSTHSHPTIVRLKGGRLLCFYILETLSEAGSTYSTLGMSYSDNDGAAWTVGGVNINSFQILNTATIYRLRVVEQNDVLTMVVGYIAASSPTNQIDHYVSFDLGASFEEIAEAEDGSGNNTIGQAYSWDLVSLPTGAVLWVGVEPNTSATAKLRQYQKFTPKQAFEDDPGGGTNLLSDCDNATAGGVAACVDDEGFVYVLARKVSGQPRSRHALVKCDAATLAGISATVGDGDDLLFSGIGAATIGRNEPIDLGNDDATHLAAFTMFPWGGCLEVLSNHNAQGFAGPVHTRLSLLELKLGGYSTIDWKVQTWGKHSDASPDTFGMLYIPIEVPSTIAAWTVATSGSAPVASVVADGMNLTATAGTYSVTRAGGSAAQPVLCWVRLKLTSAASVANDDVAVKLQIGDGSSGYKIKLRFSNNGFALFDDQSGAQIGSTVTGLNTATHHDYLISLESNKCATYYKNDVNGEEWTAGPNSGGLTNAGAITNSITWGHLANKSGTFTGSSQWLAVGCALDGCTTATGLADGFANPADLIGRPNSIHWQYVTRGAQIRSIGSAGYRNDSFKIATRYERGVHLLDPALHASPSVKWAAKNDTAQQELHYELQGVNPAGFLSSSIFLYIAKPNFRTAYLEGYTGSGWTTLITIDAAAGLSGLSYSRVGNEITVNTSVSQTANRYIEMDEFADGYAAFSGSTFQIARNSEGVWSSGDARRVVFTLLGDVSALGATGTVDIIAPQVLGIRHKMPTSFQRYRVRIPAFTTMEDKIQAGIIFAGPVAFLGQDPDWGTVFGEDPNIETSESRNGARMVQQRGQNRRRVEVSWPSGWDLTDLYTSNPDPAYIVARNSAGYDGVGVQGDATILNGLLRRTAGGRYPVVYLPKMEPATGASDESTYTGNRCLYGRIVGGVTRQVLVGDEYTDTVQAVQTVTIEEEL